jgi:hypothetical protein
MRVGVIIRPVGSCIYSRINVSIIISFVLFFQEHVIRDRAVVAVVHNELIRGHVSLGIIVGCTADRARGWL